MENTVLIRFSGLAILALWTGAPARGQVVASPEVVTAGERVTLSVSIQDHPEAGARVRAVWRPGSQVAVEQELGLTADDGILHWTPRKAGLVRIEAEVDDGAATVVPDMSMNFGVRYPQVPWSGMVTLVASGLILFGGFARAFALHLSAGHRQGPSPNLRGTPHF